MNVNATLQARLCGCCGTHGPVESHHIGRRGYSEVEIDLCARCHNYMTIADVYERKWAAEASPLFRVMAGFTDLVTRLADSAGLDITERLTGEALAWLASTGLFAYRPSQAAADPPVCNPDPAEALRQIEQLFDDWFTRTLGMITLETP